MEDSTSSNDLNSPLLDDSFLTSDNEDENSTSQSERLIDDDSAQGWYAKWKNREPSAYYIFPSAILFVICTAIWAPVLPQLKLDWYKKCTSEGTHGVHCISDKDSAQFYSGIFDSIRGFLCFSVSATIGRVSDSMGRKPILLFCIFASSLPAMALYITDASSSTAYFTSSIVSGLAGSGSAGSAAATAMVAYIADLYPAEERLVFFGYIGASASISMVLSPLFTEMATRYLENATLFLVSVCIAFVNFLYVVIVIPESLAVEKRNPFSRHTVDPFAPLRLINRSPVLKWLSFVVFLNSLPESGLVEIIWIYCDTTLGLDKLDAQRLNGMILGVVGAAGLFSQTVLIGLMKRLNIKETTVLAIAAVVNTIHLLVFASLVTLRYKEVIFVAELLAAVVFLSNPASNAIVSKFMGPYEQGFAFGTLSAVKGMTAAFSPLVFGTMYATFDNKLDKPELSFVVGAVISISALFFTIYPLRAAIRKARLVRFSHSMMFSPQHKNRYRNLLDGEQDVEEGQQQRPIERLERLPSISESDADVTPYQE